MRRSAVVEIKISWNQTIRQQGPNKQPTTTQKKKNKQTNKHRSDQKPYGSHDGVVTLHWDEISVKQRCAELSLFPPWFAASNRTHLSYSCRCWRTSQVELPHSVGQGPSLLDPFVFPSLRGQAFFRRIQNDKIIGNCMFPFFRKLGAARTAQTHKFMSCWPYLTNSATTSKCLRRLEGCPFPCMDG